MRASSQSSRSSRLPRRCSAPSPRPASTSQGRTTSPPRAPRWPRSSGGCSKGFASSGAEGGIGVRCQASREAAARIECTMKTGIHPDYVLAHVRCSCGNEFYTRSTKPELHVEICSECHPFYTGKQKLVDTGGRVERFQRRLEKAGARRG